MLEWRFGNLVVVKVSSGTAPLAGLQSDRAAEGADGLAEGHDRDDAVSAGG